jgi:phosphodiester glycosidase
VLAALFMLVPVTISLLGSITSSTNSSWSIMFVEWVRDNGARGLVNQIESIYYTWEAPSTGGPALKSLPSQPGQSVATRSAPSHVSTAAATDYPPRITPLIRPALPGEGVWRSTFTGVTGPTPVLVTSFRSNPSYPQMVAGVAWINQAVTTTRLYPGALEPSVTLPERGPEEVPISLRPRLVATFNSAFKLSDSGGGFALNGHTYAPMTNGLATAVRYTNGKVDVVGWSGGPSAGPNVMFARQNLPLIVNDGKPNPNLSDGPQWGATLGNAVQVWRSALGVDSHGNLIYAAADYQTVGSLAAIMIHAGAVRAMELDINAYWPSFITYRHPGAAGAANLLPSMIRSPLRYLTPDDRDFFAVYLR